MGFARPHVRHRRLARAGRIADLPIGLRPSPPYALDHPPRWRACNRS